MDLLAFYDYMLGFLEDYDRNSVDKAAFCKAPKAWEKDIEIDFAINGKSYVLEVTQRG